MTFSERLRDAFANRIAETIAASVTVVLAWAAYQVAPAILPAVESALSKRVLVALLVTSLCINIIIALGIWLAKKPESSLRLMYGVYWDKQKNPHCPTCQKPLSSYGDHSYMGVGYYCTVCKTVNGLSDASGKRVEPTDVLSRL